MKSLGHDISNYTETAKGLSIVEVQKSLNSDCDYTTLEVVALVMLFQLT
jgi:hypothetical protein